MDDLFRGCDCDWDCDCCCCCRCCDQDCDFGFSSCIDACCSSSNSNYFFCCCCCFDTRSSVHTDHQQHNPRWRPPPSHTFDFVKNYELQMEERRERERRRRQKLQQEAIAKNVGGYCSCGRHKSAGQKYCYFCLEDAPQPQQAPPPTQRFLRPQQRETYVGPHQSR